jgi:hypothetical protein
MIRFALFLLCVAGVFAAATFYPLGDKPLAGHLGDIYHSPVVQEKIRALDAAVGQDVQKLTREAHLGALLKKDPPHPSQMQLQKLHIKEVAPAHITSASAAPETAHTKTTPTHEAGHEAPHETARDQLSDDDRKGLDHLLSEKLKH